MVWTTVDRGGTSSYADDPLVGDVFTPTEGDVIVLGFQDNAGLVTNVSGWSLTWAQVATLSMGGGYVAEVWAAIVGASPGSGQVLVTTSAAADFDAVVCDIRGADVSGTVSNIFTGGNTPISEISYNGGANNQIGAGFAGAFASATNATLTLALSRYNAQTFTAETGFTSVAEQSGNRGALNFFIEESEVTAPEYSPVTSFADDGAIAFELLEAAVGGATISNIVGNGGLAGNGSLIVGPGGLVG